MPLKETKQYKQSTEEKKVQFEELKRKDELSAKEIARQMKRLKKLQASTWHGLALHPDLSSSAQSLNCSGQYQ